MVNKNFKVKLLEIVDECKTQREAARKLKASEQYIYRLTRELGITKWRQKNRVHAPIKGIEKICEECGEVFIKRSANNNPGRFCSKKCQGRWLGKNYGFKHKK
jgi:formylmethanofuran dehydrogenase subunit E